MESVQRKLQLESAQNINKTYWISCHQRRASYIKSVKAMATRFSTPIHSELPCPRSRAILPETNSQTLPSSTSSIPPKVAPICGRGSTSPIS